MLTWMRSVKAAASCLAVRLQCTNVPWGRQVVVPCLHISLTSLSIMELIRFVWRACMRDSADYCTCLQIVFIYLLRPFSSLFSRTTWIIQHQLGKPFWILMKQEMMGLQWHQLDHMQIICTLLWVDNHPSTLSLSFTGWLPFCCPTSSVKALKALFTYFLIYLQITVFVCCC